MSAGPILQGAGFGIQAYGKMEAAKTQADSLERESLNDIKNAKRAKAEALFNAEKLAYESMQVIEGSKADYAAAGLEGGSVAAVIRDSVINAELDRLSVIYGGDVRSKDYLNKAASRRASAKDIREASIFETLATGFKAAGTIADAEN